MTVLRIEVDPEPTMSITVEVTYLVLVGLLPVI